MVTWPPWLFYSLLSAISFASADLLVVSFAKQKPDELFLVYTALMGLVAFIYLWTNPKEWQLARDIVNHTPFIVVAITLLYIGAYGSHFRSIIGAPNAGYANALVMLHVMLLTLGSHYLLGQPLDSTTLLGVVMVLGGGMLISVTARQCCF